VVLGGGRSGADLMIIGEAPGDKEDDEGIPFIGRSGRLLMDLLRTAWPPSQRLADIEQINEGEDDYYFEELRDFLDDHIFWTNVVCCWTGEGNRDPSNTEIKACRERLQRMIYAVDPVLILAMGRVAFNSLLGKKASILDKRGTVFDIKFPSPVTKRPIRYSVMAMLHPSFLLRQGDQVLIKTKKGYTYETIEDLRYALCYLDQEYKDLYDTKFPFKPEGT